MVRIRRNVFTQTEEETQTAETKTAESQCDLMEVLPEHRWFFGLDEHAPLVTEVPYMVEATAAAAAAADSQPLKPLAAWDLGAPAPPILEPIQRPRPPRRARVQRWTWVPAEKVDGLHTPMEWGPSVQSTGMPPKPRRPCPPGPPVIPKKFLPFMAHRGGLPIHADGVMQPLETADGHVVLVPHAEWVCATTGLD